MKNRILIISFPMLLQIGYWGMLKLMLPVLPHLSEIFNVAEDHVKIMIALSFILSGISSLFCGSLIENKTNIEIVSFVTFLSISTLLVCSFSQVFWLFSLFYVLSCVIINVLSIYSRSFPVIYLSSQELIKQSISLRLFGGYSAAFFAPFLGGIIYKYFGWRLEFLVIIIWLLVIGIIAKIIGNKKHTVEKHSLLDNLRNTITHLKNRNFISNLTILSCGNAITQSYVVSIPFWLESVYHIPIDKIAYYLFPILYTGIRAPLLPAYVAKKTSEKFRTTLYMGLLFVAGLLPFFLIRLSNPSAWVWIIPGVLANMSMIGLAPFLSYNAFVQVKKAKNSAAGLLSMFSYVSGGCAMGFTLRYIKLANFYLEGIFILTLASIMCAMFILLRTDNIHKISQHP